MAGRCDTWIHKQLQSLVDRCFMIEVQKSQNHQHSCDMVWLSIHYELCIHICHDFPSIQTQKSSLNPKLTRRFGKIQCASSGARGDRNPLRLWYSLSCKAMRAVQFACFLTGNRAEHGTCGFWFYLYLFLQIWKAIIVAHSSCPEPTAVPPWWLDSELPMTPPSSKVTFPPSTLAISQWNAFSRSRCLSMMVIASLWYLQGGKMVNHKCSWGEERKKKN